MDQVEDEAVDEAHREEPEHLPHRPPPAHGAHRRLRPPLRAGGRRHRGGGGQRLGYQPPATIDKL